MREAVYHYFMIAGWFGWYKSFVDSCCFQFRKNVHRVFTMLSVLIKMRCGGFRTASGILHLNDLDSLSITNTLLTLHFKMLFMEMFAFYK